MTVKEIRGTSSVPVVDVKCTTCGNPDYPMFQSTSTDRATIIRARREAQEHDQKTGGLHRIIIAIVSLFR